MFGLDEDTLRNIKGCFSQLPDIEKVLIYGSRARDDYKTGSDIDITLLGEGLTRRNSFYPLIELLEELYLPYMFDISIFSELSDDNFINRIEREGKVLYQREESASAKNVSAK